MQPVFKVAHLAAGGRLSPRTLTIESVAFCMFYFHTGPYRFFITGGAQRLLEPRTKHQARRTGSTTLRSSMLWLIASNKRLSDTIMASFREPSPRMHSITAKTRTIFWTSWPIGDTSVIRSSLSTFFFGRYPCHTQAAPAIEFSKTHRCKEHRDERTIKWHHRNFMPSP